MHVIADRIYTPEDLLSMPDRKNYELVDRRLVERSMSQLSSWVGGRLYRFLDAFAEDHHPGWAWPAEPGYACFPDRPNKVRKPDVSFIRIERMPGGPTSEGYAYIPPDLGDEVVSPNDLWRKVRTKLDEYLAMSVRLVWIIDPEARTMYVHRQDGTVSRLREGDELSGEDVVPGFRRELASIFLRKLEPQQPHTAV
jgi:Uma2 family endonuclease